MRILICLLLALLLALGSSFRVRAEISAEQLLDLAAAYQLGFLQVCAASCYQLYATTGVIATAFSTGQLDGPEALDALGESRMLHSTCYSTLLEVQKLTPEDDKAAREHISELAKLLVLEDELLKALGDVFSHPSDAKAARVEQLRQHVSNALDEFALEIEADQ